VTVGPRFPRRLILIHRAVAAGLCTVLIASGVHSAPEELANECGDPFTNGVGPFDYNNGEERTTPAKIPIVEQFHFTPVVESLARGSTSSSAMDDIDYTLRAIPNHHRALNAMARFDIEKGGIPPRWRSAQCWFDRATRFRPDDGQVWLIYGNWYARKQRNEDALEAYTRAKRLLPDSIEVDYNLGLLYYKMGKYEKALEHAKTAYAGNYPLQGLRRRLAEKGYSLDR
jgi:hypothetical protein